MIIPMTSARFIACLPFTLAQECPFPDDWTDIRNWSNNSHDPGGSTYMGITQSTYDAWCESNGIATGDVRAITQIQGTAIYYDGFWLKYCPLLPVGLDLCFFDSRVNQGTRAIGILQVAVGVSDDEIWGPITQAAVAAISNVVSAIEKFTTRREAVYQQTRNFAYFGTDWMRRAEEIGAAAERAGLMQVRALAMHRKFMASKEYLR
jgi:lysozyme family protein